MNYSKNTLEQIEAAKKAGYEILGSGVGFNAHWAQKEVDFERSLQKRGYADFYRIAKTNCRKCGWTKRLVYAAKKKGA